MEKTSEITESLNNIESLHGKNLIDMLRNFDTADMAEITKILDMAQTLAPHKMVDMKKILEKYCTLRKSQKPWTWRTWRRVARKLAHGRSHRNLKMAQSSDMADIPAEALEP